jgi:hypothetical protein
MTRINTAPGKFYGNPMDLNGENHPEATVFGPEIPWVKPP